MSRSVQRAVKTSGLFKCKTLDCSGNSVQLIANEVDGISAV